jgi:hypothetical protein
MLPAYYSGLSWWGWRYQRETIVRNLIMSRPREKSQLYIISATREEGLVARKKLKAYTTVAAGLLIFSALVVMFSIRTPLPV